MRFVEAVHEPDRFSPPSAFKFAGEVIEAEWLLEALRATGTRLIRRRKLPADQMIWIVLAMALFRDRSIAAVISHLGLARNPADERKRTTVAKSAIPKARRRLGEEPMKWLFEKTAGVWTDPAVEDESHRWKGLSVRAIDGTTIRVADTPENEAYYGRPGSSRGAAGSPQARLVALNVPHSHLLAGLAIGPYTTGEQTLADPLWSLLPDRSITIVDRGFIAYGRFHRLHTGGVERHWLVRCRSNTAGKLVRQLSDGSRIVRIRFSSNARRSDPGLPTTFVARLIPYQIPGFPPQKLLTSLLDHKAYPGRDLVLLYHERWEIEVGWHVAPGTLPRLLRDLKRDLGLLVLPERRRRYSRREVKIKMSGYPKKGGGLSAQEVVEQTGSKESK